MVELDAVSLRVVGCLIEKQRTTPDAYPLSLNSLRLACNQATNRDPVVDYDEQTIRTAIDRLSRMGFVRLASGVGSRTAKYRHLMDDALGVEHSELALLAVLMLRGPQTAGELNQRTERLHRFGSTDAVERALEVLAARELVVRRTRRPGQKEERWAHLLGGEDEEAPAPAPATVADHGEDAALAGLERDLGELRAEVAELRVAFDRMRERLDS